MTRWIRYQNGWAVERTYTAEGRKVAWRAWRLERHGLTGDRR